MNRRSHVRHRAHNRRGLSLLEVVLAIAILGTSLAAIGELIRIGSRSARRARVLSNAQMVCQTKMSEIVAGVMPAQSTGQAPYEFDQTWVYSVETAPVDTFPGLLAVYVTAQQNLPTQQQPISYTLVRWVPDPSFEFEDSFESPLGSENEETTTP